MKLIKSHMCINNTMLHTTRKKSARLILGLSILTMSVNFAVADASADPLKTANVDDARIIAATSTGTEWPVNGRDYAGTRFSQLKQINTTNVNNLGLAWVYEIGSKRGVEATPIVVDGVMYVTGPWSIVYAIDAKTGKNIWTYDPLVPRDKAWINCCDVVNRGVAVYKGNVYVATYDARLIAINAATGKKVWETNASPDNSRPYSITAFPMVIKDSIIIGNAGGEYGIRGSVQAYDAATGALKWRWFIVPGDPSKPFENEAMEDAATTWNPSSKYWLNGGGGAPWHGMAIDPKLNLVYFGTGQPGPWSASARNPGGGDNLYTSSIVALDIDTGKYVWHYQANPNDQWDFDSTQDVVLADIAIEGQTRKVIMQAHKNGFFFILDRTTGKFISAKNYVPQNWAKGYSINGRPIEVAGAREQGPHETIPAPLGGHNWMSMSYSPKTRLVYIPAHHIPMVLSDDSESKSTEDQNQCKSAQTMCGAGWKIGEVINAKPPQSKAFGRLIAWDPAQQKEVWNKDYGAKPYNGGTVVTAGNLVFQGTADGHLLALDATNGKELWRSPVGGGVIAAPITYELEGKQYVSIAVGWGGIYGQSTRHTEYTSEGRVFTFVLNGKTNMPEFSPYFLGPLLSGIKYDPKDIPAGQALYDSNCVLCHGVPGVDKGGNIPNLGYSDKSAIEYLDKMVLAGPFTNGGMPDYTGKLNKEEIEKIKAYIQASADSIRKP